MAQQEHNAMAAASSDIRPMPPGLFVLFGATGDLAARKIVPALYNLTRQHLVTDRTAVLGVARRPLSDEAFREEMLAAAREHSRTRPVDEETWRRFAPRLHYAAAHADAAAEFAALARRVEQLDAESDAGGNRLLYLATTPELFGELVGQVGRAGLNRPGRQGAFARLVVEKPFGHDLDSACALNRQVTRHFEERDVFRIDHYLGKETVQNILVFRFANAVFDPLLNREFVDRVEITAAETVGMEGRRGPYYETAGALRDMIQNHVLQLLALMAMECPPCVRCEDVRNGKAGVLRSIRVPRPEEVAENTVRGQYTAGGRQPAYVEEEGVAPDSPVETYAAVRLFLETERWAGVPFYLRTGKRLAAKASQIVVVFKRERAGPFTEGGCDVRGPNRLIFRLSPNEGIALVFDAKVPGVRPLIRPVRMDFAYEASFASASPEAYEHLLLDAMSGDSTSFIRGDEVEASWRFIDAVKAGWDGTGLPKLATYAPGSWGPDDADRLFRDPYKRWHEP